MGERKHRQVERESGRESGRERGSRRVCDLDKDRVERERQKGGVYIVGFALSWLTVNAPP